MKDAHTKSLSFPLQWTIKNSDLDLQPKLEHKAYIESPILYTDGNKTAEVQKQTGIAVVANDKIGDRLGWWIPIITFDSSTSSSETSQPRHTRQN